MIVVSILLYTALLLLAVMSCSAFTAQQRYRRSHKTLSLKALSPLQSFFATLMTPSKVKRPSDLTIYDAEIASCKEVLMSAAETKKTDPDSVVASLLSLEKLMRAKNKLDGDETSRETLRNLDGAWRLVFTTGTVDTQKKTGRVNYFPIKAVQSFNTNTMAISNGIFLGDFPALQFFGKFEWKEKARKLEFDFDSISALGLKINLPKGGAAKIGQSTGLGSESNNDLIEKGRKPFFNWISADMDIATARGGGGGLALWKRVKKQE